MVTINLISVLYYLIEVYGEENKLISLHFITP